LQVTVVVGARRQLDVTVVLLCDPRPVARVDREREHGFVRGKDLGVTVAVMVVEVDDHDPLD
jgi:hypothetical protein